MLKGKVLGLDYGQKRIGLAIGDLEQKIAVPKGFLIIKKHKEALQKIKKLCLENQIVLIVLGLPYLLDRQETKTTQKIKQFGEVLAKKTQIKVNFMDETLSTFEAEESMSNFKKDKKDKTSGERDCLSAAIILERWFKGKF
ncbi:MAG: hypothetical protein UR28_C0017G0008 [Candidatus Peregrinibacteria bacterium GW2011_GWF2_33_10]|nr:MAG: hypothetical protein UR28_C0017G0008 [Candidatus Peregrinibacteria bacterium GW2011_GWF2_33_10]OGJ44563.1 MAG: hypothetical protein A2263_02520 [Candidatus Peregrinibacteria bacterium RIFOXYA2_FULL_33_21]OGJ44869.1 MAG: hypothetical protein A2272_01830 [Candidatus Peregrinibacteria bacterium RIFOXYA12_FULL_33_12]OGJ50050.1 MAG: hypothetical protein A2307_01460 [Candidatus Peregrinibacteria bacterium RIFOXYB2_FULL_33_20]